MEAEKFLNLYDFCWFELSILNEQPFSSKTRNSSFSEMPDQPTTPTKDSESQIQIQIQHNRSMSDQLNSSSSFESGFSSSGSCSPSPPKLYTILSGKEILGLEISPEKQSLCVTEPPRKNKKTAKENRKLGKRRSQAKSLTDLEFEELKGFMDLGFVFSEKDRDSSLADIIPGLHRLGKNNNNSNEEEKEEVKENEEERDIFEDENEVSSISRPYLSEAWEVLDLLPKKEHQNPLMNWRFPALNNEICMKDNLRFWAHTVASTVR